MTPSQDLSHWEIAPSLILRRLQQEDGPVLFQLVDRNRDHLRKFLGWLDHNQAEVDTNAFIARTESERTAGSSLTLAIWSCNEVVGLVDLHAICHVNRSASVGYWLDAVHQGRGIITRCVRALIAYSFKEMQLHRIEIRCAVENERSQRIPLALGFQREGVLREAEWHYDRYLDLVLYAILTCERQV